MRYCTKFYILLLHVLFCNTLEAQIIPSVQHDITCSGKAVTFSSNLFNIATFPSMVQWNFGDPSSGALNTALDDKEPIHVFNTIGEYYITLTVQDPGLGTVVLRDTINIVNQVNHNFGADQFLCSSSMAINTVTAPTVAGATYTWNDDTTTIGPILRVTETGSYTVLINGCPVNDTISFYITQEPNLDLGRDHVLCTGEQLSLQATSENAFYQWYLNGTQLADNESVLKVNAPGGEYVAVIDAGGCGVFRDTAYITFSNTVAPPFSLGADTLLCPKQVYTIAANVFGATAYNWHTKGLNVDDRVVYNISNGPSYSITEPGRYWAFVTITGGCEVVDTIRVRYRSDRNLQFNDTAICQGDFLILDANFGSGTYSWKSEPPQRDDQSNTNQSTYYVYSPGFITVKAQVANCIFEDSLTVRFDDSLKLNLGRDTNLCKGEIYMLQPITNALQYKWQDSSSISIFEPKFTGYYSVTATNGCGTKVDSVYMAFEDCPCALLMPNVFTPNNDGLNDSFKPVHACDMEQYMLAVYNRYGSLVFSTQNPLQGWTGMYRGKQADISTYVWTVQYIKSSTKQSIRKTGTITLIR